MTECNCPVFTLQGTSTTLYFPMPEWSNPENGINKNLDLFNHWYGDIDVIDTGINDQPLSLGGTVYICGSYWSLYGSLGLCFPLCFPLCFSSSGGMTIWLNKIDDAMNNGEKFTISELGDCLNGVYIIKDFTFNTIRKSPGAFTWDLKLERVRDID